MAFHVLLQCTMTNKMTGEPVTVSLIGDAVDFNALIVLGDLQEGKTGVARITTPFFSMSPYLELTEGVDVALVLFFVLALKGCKPPTGNQIPMLMGSGAI